MKKSIDIIWSNYIKQVNTFLGTIIKDIGLTYAGMEYLWVISDLGECTCTDIAKALYIKKSSASIMIDSLTNKKCLIKNADSADKRSYKIKLAPLGQEYIKQELAFYESYIERFRQYLTIEESAILSDLLGKVAKGINNENN